mgnify:CR=1 FL=1
MTYSINFIKSKPFLVHGVAGFGSIIGTLTSILSLGEERRLTAKIKDLIDLSSEVVV